MVTIALRRRVRTWWPALLACALVVLAGGVVITTAPAAAAAATQDPVSCANSVALVNGGFEEPTVKQGQQSTIMAQSLVPGWKTTASDGQIEIWHNTRSGSISAAAGTQWAELNANVQSGLYQDLPTVPGTVMRWSLAHRGRSGVDTMAVEIGSPGALVTQRQMSDGNSAWGLYSAFYRVPPGQTTTRFQFEAISTATGNLSIGNFLDDISFGTNACVVGTETVTSSTGGPYARDGDLLTITVNADSGGGSPSTGTSLTSPLPTGVTFVPGSLRVTSGGTTTSATDGSGDDVAEYDASARQVVVRVGTGASATGGGTLTNGEVGTVTYQVRVDPSSVPSTFTSASTVSYTDPLTGNAKTSTTNTASIVLNPVADLAVTLARTSTGPVVAGQPVTYTATLTNNGGTSPVAGGNYAYASKLTSRLPAALTGVSGTATGGACTVSGSTLTCDVGTLTQNATGTVTITATVTSDTPPATGGLVLTVTGSTASRDPAPANDSATATDDVTAVADVGVTLTASPSSPVAGTDITYTAVLTNRGPSTARSVVLGDPVPAGTSKPRASVPGGTCSVPSSSTGTVQCTVPSVVAGASTSVTIVVQSDPSRTGTVQNTVSVTAVTPDPTPADDTATVSSTLTSVADVRAVLTVPPGNVPLGGSAAYQLTISNQGPSTAVNVQISGSAPPGFTVNPPASPYCSAYGCTIPSLLPGTSVVIKGTAPVASTTAPGRATATATATAATPDPNTADNTSSTVVFVGAPSVQVSVLGAITDTRRTRGADVGDHVVWTYVITNAGDVDLTDPVVVLPGTTTAVPTTCRLGTLPKGASAACHAVQPQLVTADDVRALAVTTTVQVTGSWVGGTEVRSTSAGGSLATVLPAAIVATSSAGMLPAPGLVTTAALRPTSLFATTVPWLRAATSRSDEPAPTGR